MTDIDERLADRLQKIRDMANDPIDQLTSSRRHRQDDTSAEERELSVKLTKGQQRARERTKSPVADASHASFPSPWDRIERRALDDRRGDGDRRRTKRGWDRRTQSDRRGNTLYRYRIKGFPTPK